MDVFSFSTGSYSYWLLNGHGCEIMDELPDAPQVKLSSNSKVESNIPLILIQQNKFIIKHNEP